MKATYSPEDNKIRIYPDGRLSAEDYARVKSAGYGWAPKQGIFVAPMWTPERADLAVEMCGEIQDEDTTLAERADERAERFEAYQTKRADEAERALENVENAPDVIGHHNQRKAEKEAARIDNARKRAIGLWDAAEYWKRRAAGAIRAAKYKELPAVRARRIKTIEADKRKQERTAAESEKFLNAYRDSSINVKSIANYDHVSRCFPLADYPRQTPASQYEGAMGLWSALDGGVITPEQARAIAIPAHAAAIENARRWIAHCENRIAYEYAMLEEHGATNLLTKPERPTRYVPEKSEQAKRFDALKTAAPVSVVVAPQLFPTPRDIAERMAAMLEVEPGHAVLEPSAGTGNLLGALGGRMFGHNPERGTVHAVEINHKLAGRLQAEFPFTTVHCADFLEFRPDDFAPFDRIIMNPPFENASDIRHILHAVAMLKPGGRLVALCADGSRQNSKLRPIADYWEQLPPGTFASQGTGVNVALLVINNPL